MNNRNLLQRTAIFAITLGTATVFAKGETHLQGAGATFPAPLYKRWVAEYQKANPDVAIDYQSIGSGGGIKDLTEKTVDFAGFNAPMNKGEIEKAGGAENIIEIPSCAGAVVPAYNLTGVSEIKFSGEVLANIYQGKITQWNDPALMALNPGANLPAQAITPVYRTDTSGTTFVWTNYLSTQSEDFKGSIGAGKAVKFPVGQGGKGNEGVTAAVQQTPGALGYIEENYADQNKISYGSVQNKDGRFIKATPEAVSAAGAGAAEKLNGNQLTANIWNQPGVNAYPISSFTYLLVYKDLNNVKSKEQAQALSNFLWWATHDGQKLAAELDYAPLAQPVQQKVEQALHGLTYNGAMVNVADAK